MSGKNDARLKKSRRAFNSINATMKRPFFLSLGSRIRSAGCNMVL
jgi:hypothetical protein